MGGTDTPQGAECENDTSHLQILFRQNPEECNAIPMMQAEYRSMVKEKRLQRYRPEGIDLSDVPYFV